MTPHYVFRDLKLEDTYFHRGVEQAVVGCSKPLFEAKTQPTLLLASMIGNMYTPSLYGGLVSLLVQYVWISTNWQALTFELHQRISSIQLRCRVLVREADRHVLVWFRIGIIHVLFSGVE